MSERQNMHIHSSHWGVFFANWCQKTLTVQPHPEDPDPNPLIENLPKAIRHRARVSRPMVRRGWLENGPGPDPSRGVDDFIPLGWDEVLDRTAQELQRIKQGYGPTAVFGGSYGWSSAGRFHHAQSQVHRFLNIAIGGYVRSVNTYSAGASMVILPHILGNAEDVSRHNITWEQIINDSEVVLAFGGMALRNSRIASGGISRHIERNAMRTASERGCRFINIGPQRGDLPEEARPEWLPLLPGTDTALMLGMVYLLVSENLHDQDFLDHYCDGWAEFEDYLFGRHDGIPKTPEWASRVTRIPKKKIVELARELYGKRVLVVTAHSLQRAEFGEQPIWMATVLASVLGQIGLSGGGYNPALGTLAHYGKKANAVPAAALPQGRNNVKEFIPVARIADMLLHPGEPFDYNGIQLIYPRIRLAYWAGGNPFHHHQDLTRLSRAFQQLDTFIVHESAWTATARHADIVLPATMTLEREDIGATPTDPLMIAMHRVVEPFDQARDDYEIFSDLADRMGVWTEFTKGRSTREWLQFLYEPTRAALEALGQSAPDFETFWEQGELVLPQNPDDGGIFRAFRDNPGAMPLSTPSGRIQISSAFIRDFGYPDCPGHPSFFAPTDGPTEKHPLWLVANQPATRLHSQLDFGDYSAREKIRGREVCTMNPVDAKSRGLQANDIVRLYNDRGACLAALQVSKDIMPGVIRLPTGAWYDPVLEENGRTLCVHGNPNVLTRDKGTSSLAQGCIGQLTVVEVEKFIDDLPPIQAFDPPAE